MLSYIVLKQELEALHRSYLKESNSDCEQHRDDQTAENQQSDL